ncbi:MAG: SDR family oxidoreductase [Paracoccaceae bacterium]
MTAPASTSRPGLAIVTGASRGLGRALSGRLAREGCDLVLVARDLSRLDACATELAQTYGVAVETVSADLSRPEAPAQVFARLAQLGKTADVLINNAGFNVYGRFEVSDLDKELEMIRLHLIATTQLTKFFLQQRDRARRNRILNVSSIAALVPGPFVSVHFATRAHLLNFSLALSEEFRGADVDVTCLCPGPMQTEFFERAGMSRVRLISGWPMKTMTAAEVAQSGYRALMAGKHMVVPGRRNQLLAFAADLAPRALRTRFAKWIMDQV